MRRSRISTATRAPIDFASIVSYAGSRRMSKFLGIAAGLATLLFVLFPTPFFGSAYRLWNYGQAVRGAGTVPAYRAARE